MAGRPPSQESVALFQKVGDLFCVACCKIAFQKSNPITPLGSSLLLLQVIDGLSPAEAIFEVTESGGEPPCSLKNLEKKFTAWVKANPEAAKARVEARGGAASPRPSRLS